MVGEPVLNAARAEFHAALLVSVLTVDGGIPTNADGRNRLSVRIAVGIADQLQARRGSRLAAQSSGAQFQGLVGDFVRSTFQCLAHLRPGRWTVRTVAQSEQEVLAGFAQYSHLAALRAASEADRNLAAALGIDYMITPDVVVLRDAEPDAEINRIADFVAGSCGEGADLRLDSAQHLPKLPLLHASISTKWTIRSDRAQNARSEALNLIRNRKGRQPHIVVATAEPLPSRLASLCLGTGDIDCVYHIALPELEAAVAECGQSEAVDLLATMVSGKRLKDVADLPLDLAV